MNFSFLKYETTQLNIIMIPYKNYCIFTTLVFDIFQCKFIDVPLQFITFSSKYVTT